MKYRTFPRTELTVSELGFGAWTLGTGWWGKIEDNDGISLIHKAYDLGINFFDTADTYAEGKSESLVGEALKDRRDKVIIATKFGYDIYNNPPREGHRERPQDFSPKFIRFALENNLKRLQTDYIDLYQLHNPRVEVIRRNEVFETLEKLREEGKIRYYGSALGPDIGWFEEGAASMERRHVHSLQIIYSILEQDPARQFFPIAKEEQVGLQVRVPHASELLTDKFSDVPTFAPGDHRSFRKKEWLEEGMKKVAEVKFLTKDGSITMGQAAIKFCLSQPMVVTVLPNLTTAEEIEEYTAACDGNYLSTLTMDRLSDLYDKNFYLEEKAPAG